MEDNSTVAEMLALVFDPQANALYQWGMHLNTALNTAMTGLAVWAMLRHTPPEMSAYRWHLFNLAITCYVVDIWNSVFYVPVLCSTGFAEINAHLGLLRYFGTAGATIGIIGWTQLTGCVGNALLWAFTYRYLAMSNKLHLLKSKWARFLAVALQFYATPLVVVDLFGSAFVQSTGTSRELEKLSTAEDPFSAIEFPGQNSLAFYSLYCGFALVVPIVGLLIIHVTRRALIQLQSKIAKEALNYQRQRALVNSLLMQLIIPFTVIMLSYLTMGAALIGGSLMAPMLSRIAFFLASSHTSINAAVMLFTIRPYRNALLRKLCCFGQQNVPVMSVAPVQQTTYKNRTQIKLQK